MPLNVMHSGFIPIRLYAPVSEKSSGSLHPCLPFSRDLRIVGGVGVVDAPDLLVSGLLVLVL